MLELLFFTKPFDALEHSDVQDLAEVKRVREHLQLDYKLESYDHNHKGSIEMLADVTAMANASGGYIIIGVEEDKDQADGTPKQVVGISNGDTEANWVQGVCESGIDEKIVGLRVRDIDIGDGKSCVVIYVPNSLRKPHMISYDKHFSFRMRNGRSRRPLNMREVRTMILSMNQYQISLCEFLDERRNSLKRTVGDKPWMLFTATPIYVDLDKIDPIGNNELQKILSSPPVRVDRDHQGIIVQSEPKPRIYGVESTSSLRDKTSGIYNFLRLFRNGHFEFGEQNLDINESGRWLDPSTISVALIHFLDTMSLITQKSQISEPILISMYWYNITNSKLRPTNRREADHPWAEHYVWGENDLSIQTMANDLSDTHGIAQRLLDQIFNAFGKEKCPYFDTEGKFQLKK